MHCYIFGFQLGTKPTKLPENFVSNLKDVYPFGSLTRKQVRTNSFSFIWSLIKDKDADFHWGETVFHIITLLKTQYQIKP